MKYFSQNLQKVKDVFTRTLIIRALFDSVTDGKICSEQYVDFLLGQLSREESDEILNTQLLFLQGAIGAMTPRKFKKLLGKRVFNYLLEDLVKANKQPETKNRMILLRNNLVPFAYDDECVDQLLAWFQGQDDVLREVECTKDNQWAIVKLVHASKKFDNNQQLRTEILDKMLALDKTDAAQKAVLRCKALIANEQERAALWNSFVDPNNTDSAKLQAESMGGFNNEGRYTSLEPYQDKFFEVIQKIFETKTTDFSKTFYDQLFPITDDLASLCNKLEQLKQTVPPNLVTLRLNLEKSLDQVKRQVKQFECFCNQAKCNQGVQEEMKIKHPEILHPRYYKYFPKQVHSNSF